MYRSLYPTPRPRAGVRTCRKREEERKTAARRERERAAMGERSAMADAWKEDEEREACRLAEIIALLHTSERVNFARP